MTDVSPYCSLFFFCTLKNTAMNQMYRLSLKNRRRERKDIFEYKRRNYLCYSCFGADVSSGTSQDSMFRRRDGCRGVVTSIVEPPSFFTVKFPPRPPSSSSNELFRENAKTRIFVASGGDVAGASVEESLRAPEACCLTCSCVYLRWWD